MIAIKVIDLAKEKKLTADEVFDICDSIGIAIKGEMSVLNDSQVKKIGTAIIREAKRKEKKKKEEEAKKKKEEDKKKKEEEAKKKIEEAKRAEEEKKKTAEAKKKEEERAKKKKEEDKKALEEAIKIEKAEEKKAKEAARKKTGGSGPGKKKIIKDRDAIMSSMSKSAEMENDDAVNTPKMSKKKVGWEEEKKTNIKSVLARELDKEEKSGRLKAKFLQKKRIEKGKDSRAGHTKNKKTLEEIRKKRPKIKKIIEVHEGITVKQLSERVNIPSNEMISFLFEMGEIININQSLSKETLNYLANEYNFKYRIIGFEEKMEEVYQDAIEDLVDRAPIVTVMGHVDHGKTTLLDTIRNTEVADGESGGITQHIGAYQIVYNERQITFIDTPGHEAFTSIRARGARVTDIAVIVVAADDGIMPQTVEAVDHAKDAGVPIIVAINKIDLPNADPNKIKQSLTEYELVPEEWGGDTIVVEISAKNNKNLEELLEMILLVTDVNELKGNPEAVGTGIIIEARLDKGMGAIGSLIVKRGKIKVGDSFVTGDSYGRIRSIRNEYNNVLKDAGLSQPVEITGFSSVPKAGDKLFVVKNERVARDLLAKRDYDKKVKQMEETKRIVTLENLAEVSREGELKKLKIILKADSIGSADAVEKSLKKIEADEIKINVIHSGVGAITESDILLAAAANAIVIGFGVVATPTAIALNAKEKADMRTYTIIYKLIDDIQLAFEGLLEPETEIVEKGKAEVREVFKVTKIGKIAGSYIMEGSVERGNMARVVRDGAIIHEGKVTALHRFKDDVKTVASGYECGIKLDSFQDIKKDDILEFYIVV